MQSLHGSPSGGPRRNLGFEHLHRCTPSPSTARQEVLLRRMVKRPAFLLHWSRLRVRLRVGQGRNRSCVYFFAGSTESGAMKLTSQPGNSGVAEHPSLRFPTCSAGFSGTTSCHGCAKCPSSSLGKRAACRPGLLVEQRGVRNGRGLSCSHVVNALARATGHVSGKPRIFKEAQGREFQAADDGRVNQRAKAPVGVLASNCPSLVFLISPLIVILP